MKTPLEQLSPEHDGTPNRRLVRPPPAPETLTKAELDCLHLIAEGHTNPQIARELCLSIDAVKSRMRRLLTKLGARDRAQAVNRGWQCHLLGGDQT